MISMSESLGDDVVYRRTAAGQRELVVQSGRYSALERRFLSIVTGHTPLRVLVDMGIDGPGMPGAVQALVEARLT